MYSIYGCPMHYGVGDEGLIYSLDYLNQYYDLNIPIVPEITMPDKHLANLKNLDSVVATCRNIARHQHHIIQHHDTPLFIAGDHSAVIGSISGTSVNYENLGLIWIDAHPDINTDQTTVTGNIHGMPVAALLGMGEKSLTNILSSSPKLRPENIVMLGLRDIDPPEQKFLDELHIKYYTYDDIQKTGLTTCIEESIQYLSHLKAIHLSFDVDSMDPDLMPGVSVPVKSGFTVDQVYEMINAFLNRLPIAAMDIVEFNMTHDVDHRTSDFVNGLIHHILDMNEENTMFYNNTDILHNQKAAYY
ncbi:arginase [Catenibacillus scindens]|uniref:Arginase n=1 Tax=Catenibacillus scindens TaxID=673271 RepID=A0A7W8M4D5_9FIRM|nr:arginase [Catenibacillus scindens]MBB5264008.1 arginase [Catenibacillus scindens]